MDRPTNDQPIAARLVELLELMAEQIADRVLVALEGRTLRTLTLAALDVSTLGNLLDVAGQGPVLDQARELTRKIAAELLAARRPGGIR